MLPLHPYDPPTAGPYRLLARLSEDTHTRSYLGTASGRGPVRVRILRSGHATDPTTRAAFTHRVENTRRLRDPHVAAVLDSDLNAPVPWVATEQPLGADLAGLVTAHGALPTAALHPLAVATAQGLAALHAAQDAHGSLSPAGVLLTGERALLADPGVTPAPETGDAEDSVFSAPEGGGAPAGDVFSWAAVLCFAASGIEGPGGLDRVPLQLRGVVDACLRENANLRPSAVDLVSMLGGASSTAAWPPELLPAVESSAADMRRAFPAEPAAQAQASGPAPAPGSRGGFVGLTAGALVLTLLVAAGTWWGYGRVFDPYEQTASAAEDPVEESGLITDAACLDGSGFPDPSGQITDLDAMQVGFSPDGDALAIGSFNHGLTLWDWREREEYARPVAELNGIGPMVFAPEGCFIAATSLQENEGQERAYRLTTTYDLPSGNTEDHLGPQPEERPDGSQELYGVSDVAFSPDGRWMALSNNVSATNTDPPVGVIDTQTGEITATFGDTSVPHLEFLDESRLALYTQGTIEVWDVEDEELLQTVRNVSEIRFVAVPGVNQIVYVDNQEVVWHDLEDSSEVAAFPIEDYSDASDPWVNHVGVDPERGLVHFSWSYDSEEEADDGPPDLGTDRGSETQGHLWDVSTGEDLIGDDPDLMPRPVAFHEDVIASVNQDGNVDLFDPDTLEIIDTIE